MSFHEITSSNTHEILTDNVNLVNVICAALLVQLNILATMHQISDFARELTPIITAFTAFALFIYNVKKLVTGTNNSPKKKTK